MNLRLSLILPTLLLWSCSKDLVTEDNCPSDLGIVSEFENEDQEDVIIYDDGSVYFVNEANCQLVGQYFDPGFFENIFNRTDSGVYFVIDESTFLKPVRNTSLDFEGISDPISLFRQELEQTDLFLTNFTLQSPSAPTVAEYVQLQNCILERTCHFIDNRFELATDPTNGSNQVMKFVAVPPVGSMFTSKTSITTTLAFFEKGDDFWFEGSFYIVDNLPTTLADFESSFFLESPGPRMIFRGDKLAVENKFGEKLTFDQPESTAKSFPLGQWVTIKIHLKYDDSNGVIQVWQDDQLIIDQMGPNIPLDFWVQDRVEMGITATQAACTLLLDNVRFSDEPF